MRPGGKRAAAADAWRLIMEFGQVQWARASGTLQQQGLTPGHLKALLLLEPGAPRSMGSVAQAFACDASTITWLIDRLEERGLVERRMLPTDRRVKTVVLTARGVELKRKVQQELYEPPSALFALDRRTLETLRDVFTSLKKPAAPPARDSA